MKSEEEKPHLMDTLLGIQDCNPGHSSDPYISSGSKRKPEYDRMKAGQKPNSGHV
jgi:hypothetical protein